jgi:hypothetical protein
LQSWDKTKEECPDTCRTTITEASTMVNVPASLNSIYLFDLPFEAHRHQMMGAFYVGFKDDEFSRRAMSFTIF